MSERQATAALRIAIFAQQFAPLVGGAEVQAQKLAQSLQARSHVVQVYTWRLRRAWPQREVIAGVPVRRLGGIYLKGRLLLGLGLDWVSYANTCRALWRDRAQYDLIYVTLISPWAGIAALVGRLTHKPVLINCASVGPEPDAPVQVGMTTWLYPGAPTPAQPWRRVPPKSWSGGDITTMRSWWPAWRFAQRLMRGDHVHFTAISTRTETYLARNGYDPARIHVLPNTVIVPPAAAPRATARTAPRVVCVARQSYPKGVDVLLSAWSLVQARYPAAHLFLAGTGPLESAHRQLAAELGVEDSVTFLGNYHAIDDLLHSADVFVLPSRWEGMPNALLEACAHGLPCVATCVSGSEDIITDGVSGLLVPPLDHEALAEALLRFLNDPALAERCAQQARLVAETRYQPDLILDQYLRLLRQLTSGSAGVPVPVEATA